MTEQSTINQTIFSKPTLLFVLVMDLTTYLQWASCLLVVPGDSTILCWPISIIKIEPKKRVSLWHSILSKWHIGEDKSPLVPNLDVVDIREESGSFCPLFKIKILHHQYFRPKAKISIKLKCCNNRSIWGPHWGGRKNYMKLKHQIIIWKNYTLK